MQSSRRSDSEWQGLVSEVRARAACCGYRLISARSTAVHMEDERSSVMAKRAEKMTFATLNSMFSLLLNNRLNVQASKLAFLNVGWANKPVVLRSGARITFSRRTSPLILIIVFKTYVIHF